MRATNLLLLLTATLAAAYTIPNNSTEGVYRVYTNKDGVEVHEPILSDNLVGVSVGEAQQNLEKKSDILERRPPGALEPIREFWCGCGWGM